MASKHGERQARLAANGDMGLMQQYVSTLDGLARKLAEEGAAEQSIDALEIPQPFNGWLIPSFFSANLHFLYQRHLQKRVAAAT
jgi:hypothetical protein